MKTCSGCGKEIKVWGNLPLVGYQDDYQGGCYELRNCTKCHSTLCVQVGSRPNPKKTRRAEVAEPD